jgi:hypothetical protein
MALERCPTRLGTVGRLGGYSFALGVRRVRMLDRLGRMLLPAGRASSPRPRSSMPGTPRPASRRYRKFLALAIVE